MIPSWESIGVLDVKTAQILGPRYSNGSTESALAGGKAEKQLPKPALDEYEHAKQREIAAPCRAISRYHVSYYSIV